MKLGGHTASRSYSSCFLCCCLQVHAKKQLQEGKVHLGLQFEYTVIVEGKRQAAGHTAAEVKKQGERTAGGKPLSLCSVQDSTYGMVAPILRVCVFPPQLIQPRNFLTGMLRT